MKLRTKTLCGEFVGSYVDHTQHAISKHLPISVKDKHASVQNNLRLVASGGSG